MDEETDEVCENCGEKMFIKYGRFGKFIACKNYPECKTTKPLVNKIGVKCPKCQEGDIILRKSKKGKAFYGCSNYPECDFIDGINQQENLYRVWVLYGRKDHKE